MKKQRIFIADGQPVVRDGLSVLFGGEDDFEVCCSADNVKNALRAVAECKPDIMITGLVFEDGSGFRLIEDILFYNKELPILVFSAQDESVYAERSIRAGARGYIMKREPTEKLVLAVRKLINGGICLSDKMESRLLSRFSKDITEAFESSVGVLNNRELEVYLLLGGGVNKHEMAKKLNLSVRTIDTYLQRIKKKLNLRDTREVIIHAAKNTTWELN